MREVEVKSVVDDLDLRRRTIVERGATLVYEGRLEDRRYDTREESLAERDEVLRVRTYWRDGKPDTALEWKGPRTIEDGYRVREEQSVTSGSLATLELILDRLGYHVTKAIDRYIVQYEIEGAVVRFERYPRMDDLVEVEGDPDAIERAVRALGMEREGFTGDSLAQFAQRYERRTGMRAALADADVGERSDMGGAGQASAEARPHAAVEMRQGDGDDGTGR